jgi:hypothetical protein
VLNCRVGSWSDETEAVVVDFLEHERGVHPSCLPVVHVERVRRAVKDAGGGMVPVPEVVGESVDDERAGLD